ncbi:YolD-like family protein [Sporosarcina beigongshangi]|uniref:YolD-like family protein n=1 Tax=Sporosarcina beigongshangi TaxID=2782538 RepID=UPI00193A2CB4|nr:YolD-like family protein [Sporosarcina beigongshangi]
MMLTEHAQAMRKWLESEGLLERPFLDDWELQSIQEEIEIAYKRQCQTSVAIWRKGKELFYNGKISELDHRLNCISIAGLFGDDCIPVIDVLK